MNYLHFTYLNWLFGEHLLVILAFLFLFCFVFLFVCLFFVFVFFFFGGGGAYVPVRYEIFPCTNDLLR